MIDILLATYNGERFLKDQIDSILKQSYTAWRLLVHDDGSSDNTVEIVSEYQRGYPDKIVLINDGIKTGGARNNFFHLMRLSTAPYIMFCDQDDVWLGEKIQCALDEMIRLEEQFDTRIPLLIFTDVKIVTEELNLVEPSFWKSTRLNPKKCTSLGSVVVQNIGQGSTFLFNRVLCDAVKCKSSSPAITMHDWWLMLFVTAFGKSNYITKSTMLYRQHRTNVVGSGRYSILDGLKKFIFSIESMKDEIRQTQEQAYAFYTEFQDLLNEKQLFMLREYANLKSKKPIYRKLFVWRNRVWRTPWSRNIAFLLLV